MINAYKCEQGYATIEEDEYCSMDSPRVDCDNLGTFITWMNNECSPDDNNYSSPDDFYEYNGLTKTIARVPKLAKMVILPVYAYVHTETRYSTVPFGYSWDSGFAGFIYVSYEDIKKEYKCKYVTKSIICKVTEVLESEVKAYDQWVNDPTFCITIYDKNAEFVDSCCGYYNVERARSDFGISCADYIRDYKTEDRFIIAVLKKEI